MADGPALYFRGSDLTTLFAALAPELVAADSFARVFDALNEWSSFDRLGEIACPTLLLAGRHDVFCSPQQHDRIARRIAHADQVVFENSGHFMWIEEPDCFFPSVRDWFTTTCRPIDERGSPRRSRAHRGARPSVCRTAAH